MKQTTLELNYFFAPHFSERKISQNGLIQHLIRKYSLWLMRDFLNKIPKIRPKIPKFCTAYLTTLKKETFVSFFFLNFVVLYFRKEGEFLHFWSTWLFWGCKDFRGCENVITSCCQYAGKCYKIFAKQPKMFPHLLNKRMQFKTLNICKHMNE